MDYKIEADKLFQTTFKLKKREVKQHQLHQTFKMFIERNVPYGNILDGDFTLIKAWLEEKQMIK